MRVGVAGIVAIAFVSSICINNTPSNPSPPHSPKVEFSLRTAHPRDGYLVSQTVCVRVLRALPVFEIVGLQVQLQLTTPAF